MFTGLVQTVGWAEWAGSGGNRLRIEMSWDPLQRSLELGDSVAVDGLCLTVVGIWADGFEADVSPETRQRSTLGIRQGRWRVNLEGSLRAGDKIGGHFVSGHIDGIGHLIHQTDQGTAWMLGFRVPDPIARYIVPKGSIAINGISLTVANPQQEGCYFETAVIPHTYEHTSLSHLGVGDPVNIEADILGKYVEKLLRHPDPDSSSGNSPDLSLAFLAEHGYA